MTTRTSVAAVAAAALLAAGCESAPPRPAASATVPASPPASPSASPSATPSATRSAAPSPSATSATPTPVPGVAFWGVRDGRLARFRGDAVERWYTEREPGGGVRSVAEDHGGPYVAWTQGEGTCAATVRYAAAGRPATVVAGRESGTNASYPAWLGRTRIAYLLTRCYDPAIGRADRTALHVYDVRTGRDRALRDVPHHVNALTAGAEGRYVSWTLDGTVTRYDVSTGRTLTVPSRRGCRWVSADVADGGDLAAVETCGSATRLRRVRGDGTSTDVRALPHGGLVHLGARWDEVLLDRGDVAWISYRGRTQTVSDVYQASW